MEIREMKSFLSSEFNRYITATDRLNSMLLTSAKRVKELEAKNEQLEQQLKEANEVIEFYSEFWEGDLGTSTYDQKGNDLEYMKESGRGKWKAGKRARQYLTKYKVKG